jgi:hypothetical protein
MSTRKRHPQPDAPAPTVQALTAAIEAEKQQRAAACLDELQAVLKRHGCELLPQVTITGVQVSATWGVRPLDAPAQG